MLRQRREVGGVVLERMTLSGAQEGGRFPPSFETVASIVALPGRPLPAEAERELNLASQAYQSDEVAERHLWRARKLAPDHAAVLIGFYRYYFYKNRLDDALVVARLCLLHAARENALDPDWRKVSAEDADFGSYDAALPRFWLFTLKAYAYLQLRLGNLAEGGDAARKVLALDPSDKVGASVLLDVLARAGMDDD